MKRYATVEAAVDLVIGIYEANHITCNTDFIRNRVYSWYCHSDTGDVEMLAGCALMGTDWFPEATYQMTVDAKEYWFPHDIENEFSIGEIEMAQHDARWW